MRDYGVYFMFAGRMKRIAYTILFAVTCQAFAQGDTSKIKQEAQRCANALLTSDYERVVAYTHKRVIAGVGGRETMIAKLKAGTEQMRAQGISFTRVEIGEPQKPRKIGEWFCALVPQKIVMKVPDGRLEQESHLLGISEDEGKSWVFLDVGPISKEQLSQVFPEFNGKIELPEKQKPVFKKD
jgi:hypothetical protein